jgi:O-antigen biosynthesis protein WbqV
MIRLPAARLRHRYRVQRHAAAGRALNEILFASEEPTIEIGIAGVMAAKPNEPPMATLREWLAALEQAIARDDRAAIKALLKEAVPEFGAASAGATVASAPPL